MDMKLWAAASVVAVASVGVAQAQNTQQGKLSNDALRIGVLTDISGVYAVCVRPTHLEPG